MSERSRETVLTPRPVRPEDAAALHGLLLAGLPDVPADAARWLARWDWQYRDNPFRQDRPAGWVLEDGGRVLGHLGAVHVPVAAGGRRGIGVIGADYVVSDEALRTGGVFAGLQLAQAFFDGTAGCLRMATTANEKTGAVFGRFGCRPVEWTREFWRAPATLVQQVRTCRGGVNRAVRRLMSGPLGSVGRGVLGAVYGIAGHRPALPIPPGCELDIGMPERVLEAVPLWETMLGNAGDAGTAPAGDGGAVPGNLSPFPRGSRRGSDDAPKQIASAVDLSPLPRGSRRGSDDAPGQIAFAIDRTREFLDWRYVRHPESASIRSLLVRTRDRRVLGAGVVFIEEQGRRRVAFIEELLAVPDRPEVMHTLVCAALRLACDHGVEHLVCTAGRAGLRGRFWEYGFESRARSAPALVVGDWPGESQALSAESLAAGAGFYHGDMF